MLLRVPGLLGPGGGGLHREPPPDELVNLTFPAAILSHTSSLPSSSDGANLHTQPVHAAELPGFHLQLDHHVARGPGQPLRATG